MDLLVLLPVPPVIGLLCFVLRRQVLVESVNAIGSLATLGAGVALALRVFSGEPVNAAGDLLYIDGLGALLIVVIVLVAFLAAVYSIGYLRRDIAHGKVTADRLGLYYLCYHGFVWTM